MMNDKISKLIFVFYHMSKNSICTTNGVPTVNFLNDTKITEIAIGIASN